jgi:hypothetical protein
VVFVAPLVLDGHLPRFRKSHYGVVTLLEGETESEVRVDWRPDARGQFVLQRLVEVVQGEGNGFVSREVL